MNKINNSIFAQVGLAFVTSYCDRKACSTCRSYRNTLENTTKEYLADAILTWRVAEGYICMSGDRTTEEYWRGLMREKR